VRSQTARFCHLSGGELEQIQFLLGHASVQTTERYLACKQKLRHAVNDIAAIHNNLIAYNLISVAVWVCGRIDLEKSK
jgi:integrase